MNNYKEVNIYNNFICFFLMFLMIFINHALKSKWEYFLIKNFNLCQYILDYWSLSIKNNNMSHKYFFYFKFDKFTPFYCFHTIVQGPSYYCTAFIQLYRGPSYYCTAFIQLYRGHRIIVLLSYKCTGGYSIIVLLLYNCTKVIVI